MCLLHGTDSSSNQKATVVLFLHLLIAIPRADYTFYHTTGSVVPAVPGSLSYH